MRSAPAVPPSPSWLKLSRKQAYIIYKRRGRFVFVSQQPRLTIAAASFNNEQVLLIPQLKALSWVRQGGTAETSMVESDAVALWRLESTADNRRVQSVSLSDLSNLEASEATTELPAVIVSRHMLASSVAGPSQ